MKGTVKFFNAMKNFGFIAGEDGKEYFVHASSLNEGVSLRENDAVEFDVEEGDRGPKAVNVKKADASEAPADEEEPEAEEAEDEEKEE
ncbi:MAG: cold shock domain-containing protein [Nanoarchaeota archaeon]|nr:cold shock domain-containing protein [Nanoarchaeota archaeon]MCG2718186.1 cold shock domain-containing protein [Nanoarchaeota archaeon]